MASFDPAAATAVYLAALSPAAHAKASAYTHGGHWLLLWNTVVAVLAAWIVLRSGVLTRTRDGIERRKPRPWLAVAAVVGLDALIEGALSLPWNVYAAWWREKSYGLTSQAFAGWLGEWAMALVISAIGSVILMSLLYAVIRRSQRSWWVWSGGVVLVFMVALMTLTPVLIEPIFNHYTPAPNGPVRDEVVAMARQVGVPSDKIYIFNGSKQSNRYTANVAGMFGTTRIAMSDVMFAKDADLAEVRGVMGHEMGHYVLHHTIKMGIAYGLLAIVGFFLVDRLFGGAVSVLGAKGIGGIADPAGVPVIGLLLAVLALIATPLTASITRVAEAQADRFSLEHFNAPDGLSKALVKTIEYRAATPSRLEELIFYDHPAVGLRVRRAMDWKAAHPPAPEPTVTP